MKTKILQLILFFLFYREQAPAQNIFHYGQIDSLYYKNNVKSIEIKYNRNNLKGYSSLVTYKYDRFGRNYYSSFSDRRLELFTEIYYFYEQNNLQVKVSTIKPLDSKPGFGYTERDSTFYILTTNGLDLIVTAYNQRIDSNSDTSVIDTSTITITVNPDLNERVMYIYSHGDLWQYEFEKRNNSAILLHVRKDYFVTKIFYSDSTFFNDEIDEYDRQTCQLMEGNLNCTKFHGKTIKRKSIERNVETRKKTYVIKSGKSGLVRKMKFYNYENLPIRSKYKYAYFE